MQSLQPTLPTLASNAVDLNSNVGDHKISELTDATLSTIVTNAAADPQFDGSTKCAFTVAATLAANSHAANIRNFIWNSDSFVKDFTAYDIEPREAFDTRQDFNDAIYKLLNRVSTDWIDATGSADDLTVVLDMTLAGRLDGLGPDSWAVSCVVLASAAATYDMSVEGNRDTIIAAFPEDHPFPISASKLS